MLLFMSLLQRFSQLGVWTKRRCRCLTKNVLLKNPLLRNCKTNNQKTKVSQGAEGHLTGLVHHHANELLLRLLLEESMLILDPLLVFPAQCLCGLGLFGKSTF